MKRNSRTSVTTSIFLILAAFLSSSLAADGPCGEPLVFGWETWEPYQYLEDGELKGFDIEIITAIVEDMGCELSFVKRPWKRLLDDLENGAVHLVAGAFYLEEREAFAWVSPPYRQDRVTLWVAPGQNLEYTQLTELAGTTFRLGVTRGYYYGEAHGLLLEDPDLTPEQIVEVVDVSELLPMLVRGRIDGFLADEVFYSLHLRENPLRDEVERHPMAVGEEDTFVLLSRSAVSPELAEAFTTSFLKLRKDGTFDRAGDRYLR